MSNDDSKPSNFDREVAAKYDERFATLAAMKDCLHLVMRLAFAELPPQSRILCVGVGTGAELLYLAEAFPGFQFVATDPSAPMLDVCRERTAAAGVIDRVTFHNGYLDTWPESAPFDAATCILVSQFLVDTDRRSALFREIAARLKSRGRLLSADLAADGFGHAFEPLLELWMRAWRHSGIPDQQIESMCAAFGRDVAVLPSKEIVDLIASSGFERPVPVFQALLVRAWFAKRAW